MDSKPTQAEATEKINLIKEEMIMALQRVDRLYIDSVLSSAFMALVLEHTVEQRYAYITMCQMFALSLGVPTAQFSKDIHTTVELLHKQASL